MTTPLHTPTLLLCLLLTSFSFGCQPPATDAPSDTETATESPAAIDDSATDDSATETTGEVAYEPAYPADVSTEGLDADDTAQQQSHSHGGEEHAHGEGDHAHDEAGDHGDGHEHGDDHDHGGGHAH